MLGAIIGDLAGSIYEFEQINNFHKVKINNVIEDNAFFSDDTILTIAVADAILSNIDYENKLKEYSIDMAIKFQKIFLILKQCFHPVLQNGQKEISKVIALEMAQ